MVSVSINPRGRAASRFALAGLLCVATFYGALAEGGDADVSAWDQAAHSAVRLLSGRTTTTTTEIPAAIEIVLAPGWKTYWRYPGDAGVPPRFDLAASENVADVIALFPAPQRFKDGSGTSIGYSEKVVIPLRITPKDASQPVTLRATIDYAICEKLCVPVEAKAMLKLAPASAPTRSSIDEALKRVPRASRVGAPGPFVIAKAFVAEGAPARVIVDIIAPAGQDVDLFAEGPTTDWNLPLPEPIEGAPAGHRRFSFNLDGLPPGASAKGAILTLTATTRGDALQAPLTLN